MELLRGRRKEREWEERVKLEGYVIEGEDADRLKRWAKEKGYIFPVSDDGKTYEKVVFDPNWFDPRETLDKKKFGFLVNYISPGDKSFIKRDIKMEFNISNSYLMDGVYEVWKNEGIIKEQNGWISANADILEKLGFTTDEVIEGNRGIIKIDTLKRIIGKNDLSSEIGGKEVIRDYLINFEVFREYINPIALAEIKARIGDRPIEISEFGKWLFIEDKEAIKEVLSKAKEKYGLNIKISGEHVIIGEITESMIEREVESNEKKLNDIGSERKKIEKEKKKVMENIKGYENEETENKNIIETLYENGSNVFAKRKALDEIIKRMG